MRGRWAVVLAIAAGCEATAEQPVALTPWIVPPVTDAWPLPAARGSIGRQQAPQLVADGGISGSVGAPLRQPTSWQVPGDGPARAIVYGTVAGAHAIDLVEIDSGRVVWRDLNGCGAPVVGVTQDVVVCADGAVVRAVGLDGKPRWQQDGSFVVMTDDRVVLQGDGDVVVVDADLGDEIARLKLPDGIASDLIDAACGDAGRELFVSGRDGTFSRIVGGKVAWTVRASHVVDLDACTGTSVVVTMEVDKATSVIALARDSGKELGRVDQVLGHWAARGSDAQIEIATSTGVARYPRDLRGAPQALESLPLGALIASRGELRLVRGTANTAVLLDRRGVRAFVPFAEDGAALGDRAWLASSWTRSPGHVAHRRIYPPRYARALRLAREVSFVAVPAELRDLPEAVDVDPSTAIPLPLPDVVPRVVLDASGIYVLAESTVVRWTPSGVQAVPGPCELVAILDGSVVCGRKAAKGFEVVGAGWVWKTQNIDGLARAGNAVLAWDADRLHVLDARTGTVLGGLASDTGASLPATLVDLGGTELVVSAERGHVVARLVRVELAPVWSVRVDGVVRRIERAGDGVLVMLEDGDAYRIDARTAAVTALAGISYSWSAEDDLITTSGLGGPIPPSGWPPSGEAAPKPAAKKATAKNAASAKNAAAASDDEPKPPRLVTPIAPPPNMSSATQLTIYGDDGSLRARNDYPLSVTPGQRTPGAPIALATSITKPGEVLVVDPATGDPIRRVRLPHDAVDFTTFSTVVDGTPIVGMLLANPVRVVLF